MNGGWGGQRVPGAEPGSGCSGAGAQGRGWGLWHIHGAAHAQAASVRSSLTMLGDENGD